MPKRASSQVEDLKNQLTRLLDDNKATDIVVVDIRGKSSIADYMIIASGTSARQVVSLANKVRDIVKPATETPMRIEGQEEGAWVLIDAGDILVHLFRPEVREFYSLEKIWNSVTDDNTEKVIMPAE